ncbi:hypothetical protein AAFF_G00035620 [Aldrovandia affinis]|uniref:Uncharacterized protein n=1 Tax=Aldrovandia affinis TaxID=143900 RepID=A0AAD7S5E9_9TELE|nr:hypothetical protein AAFF_G00035620 [Aldrovandia affinis]
MATDNKIQFWRRNAKVPGRFLKEAPKPTALSIKTKKASSFHEFARSTNDAWDIGDDEDEDFLGAARLASLPPSLPSPPQPPPPPLPPLLSSNSLDAAEAPPTDTGSPRTDGGRDKAKTDSRPTNGRVVKSCSEAQLSSATVRSPLQKQQSLPLRPIIPLVARISDQNASGAPPMTIREKTRLDKFRQLLASPNTDLEELRKHSWSGIPREVRPITWRLLSGYLPANMERRDLVLRRKRDEYFGFIEQYYHSRTDESHRDTYRQPSARGFKGVSGDGRLAAGRMSLASANWRETN